MSASAVYEGWIRHRRFEPVEHEFRYRLFLMYLDLDELPRLLDPYPLWSARRPAPARFRRADFMGDPERPLAECARDAVEEQTGAPARRPGADARQPAHPRPRLQPGLLLLLLRRRRGAGRGGSRRRQQHPLGRAPSLCPGARRAPGNRAGARARQGPPRLAPDGDGPDLRLPRQRARRAAQRPDRVAPGATLGGPSTPNVARLGDRSSSTPPSRCAAASSAARC